MIFNDPSLKPSYDSQDVEFSSLKGMTITEIETCPNKEYVAFKTSTDEVYVLHHIQDCCECVELEDITGDLSDLLNSEILVAEESSNPGNNSEYGESSTWTFYKIATIKGWVDFRFLGESNGYYSEEVSFLKLK